MISDDEREGLHFALDAILNARATLEKLDATELTGQQRYSAVVQPRAELFKNASTFLRRVIGSALHKQEMALLFSADLVENAAGAEVTATIANSLRSFLPLFMASGRYEDDNSDEPILKIIEDFIGIYWNDDPRFFSTESRTQGTHKRPYRLARLRLTALDWDKYLATVGLSPLKRHLIIAGAYRTDWDAIRKWPESIEQFGLKSSPPRDPESVKAKYPDNSESVLEAIRRDGDAYWLERGSASAGKGL